MLIGYARGCKGSRPAKMDAAKIRQEKTLEADPKSLCRKFA